MLPLKTIGAGLAALSLSACSSGTNGVLTPDLLTFAEYQGLGDRIDGRSEDLNFTDPSTLPTAGAYEYNGVLGVALEDSRVAAGDLNLTARFDQSDIVGSVTNIVSADEIRLSGQLDISEGMIVRTDDPNEFYTFGADLDGLLVDDEGIDFDVAAFLLGDFLGGGAGYVVGEVNGDILTQGEIVDIVGGASSRRGDRFLIEAVPSGRPLR